MAKKYQGRNSKLTVQNLNLLDKLEELGYDPIVEMVGMAQDITLDDNLKASIHKELAQYVMPKRKSIDFTAGKGTEFNLSIKNYGSEEKDPSSSLLPSAETAQTPESSSDKGDKENGDRDPVSVGPETVSDAAVELLGEGWEESSGSVASESGERSDDDQLDAESSS